LLAWSKKGGLARSQNQKGKAPSPPVRSEGKKDKDPAQAMRPVSPKGKDKKMPVDSFPFAFSL
jgi:hypothetical protein